MADFPIRMRASLDGAVLVVKALIAHPMHNGFARNEKGELIAAHYITRVTLRVNGEIVAETETGSGIARDPLFGWRLSGCRAGDRVGVSWHDNRGLEGARETVAA